MRDIDTPVREAKRPLAGPLRGSLHVLLGRYTTDQHNHWARSGAAGRPAVTLRTDGLENGARTYTDPEELGDLMYAIAQALLWLRQKIHEEGW